MRTRADAEYHPGLEGVIAGESAICWVDADAGLLYRGYDIHELAQHVSFEDIVWLLLHSELPTPLERQELTRQLTAERRLPEPVLGALRLLPADTHPMDALRTGVSMLGALDRERQDNSHAARVRQAVRLVARVSSLVTSSWRISHGQELMPPRDDLGHAARFLYEFAGRVPETWERETFDTVLVLYAEHEFNASTFAARVTASTLADLYAAVTSALGALKGPLHGGANEASQNMLAEIGSPDRAEQWVRERLARKERIMGFGHRVYRQGDSRVPAMRELARAAGRRVGQEHWIAICERLEAVMAQEKHLCANVDLYAAPLLRMMGLPPELNTPIFACARVAGWCAHVIEQHEHNRLIRPSSRYTGPARRHYRGAGRKADRAA